MLTVDLSYMYIGLNALVSGVLLEFKYPRVEGPAAQYTLISAYHTLILNLHLCFDNFIWKLSEIFFVNEQVKKYK